MRLLSLLALAMIMLMNLSCVLVSAVAAKTVGQSVPAVYVPAKEPLLVLAESYRPSARITIDADQLAAYVTEEITRHQIAPTIDPVQVMDLRSRDPGAFKSLKISEIGRQLGASQVLYINMMESSVEEAGTPEFMKAVASARLKIVDAQTGETRWPADAIDGHPVAAQSPLVRSGDGTTESTLRQGLQQNLALQIGRLFRKYEQDE